MKALIIIACVIGYFIMWVVAGVIGYRWELVPRGDSSFFGFFWWITLPILLVAILMKLVNDWLDKRKEKQND